MGRAKGDGFVQKGTRTRTQVRTLDAHSYEQATQEQLDALTGGHAVLLVPASKGSGLEDIEVKAHVVKQTALMTWGVEDELAPCPENTGRWAAHVLAVWLSKQNS